MEWSVHRILVWTMRRPSTAVILAGLALIVAVTALLVALNDDSTAQPEAQQSDRPVGLWRALPTDQDLPEGWRVESAGVSPGADGANAQLAGPSSLSGYVYIWHMAAGDDSAHLALQDWRESADALPGQRRESIDRLGNEAVAIRQERPLARPGGDGPILQTVLVVWRRGDVIAQLSLQDVPAYVGPGRTQPTSRIEMTAVEELARAIDARLEQSLK
jgi:hypothetical protein